MKARRELEQRVVKAAMRLYRHWAKSAQGGEGKG